MNDLDECVSIWEQFSRILATRMKYGLPLIGATWGDDLWLGSYCKADGAFHEIAYVVAERLTGNVIGQGATKSEALQLARASINIAGSVRCLLDKISAARAERRDRAQQQYEALFEQTQGLAREINTNDFRRSVFDKSKGSCHYCSAPLSLREKWHVEHMTPRCRGGSGDISNLVASCPSCNFKKSFRTAEEFFSLETSA